MYDIHRGIGEGLFVVFIIVTIAIYLLGRNGRTAPGWLVGGSHALLTLQVALGVILLLDGKGKYVPWYHPVLGIAAFLAIGLFNPLRRRLGTTSGLVVGFAILAALTLLARIAATM